MFFVAFDEKRVYIFFDSFEFRENIVTVSRREKAKKELVGVLSGELSSLLSSPERMQGSPMNRQTISMLSLSLAERIIQSDTFLSTVVEFAPRKDSQWLTTEEAAKMSGFSRPFIVALLDSDAFDGQVTKTDKGHRRVATVDFKRWMSANKRPQTLPNSVDELRAGPRHAEPASKETPRAKARRSVEREEALALARGMGLG